MFVGTNGNSYGFGIEGSVNAAKGKSNSDSERWQNSRLNADKIITNSEEGGLSLDAANIKAKRWEAELQSLTLTSRQDTEKYESKQVSAGASGSIAYGSGGGASVNAAYSKASVDYAQVKEQTGIQVGEEGINATIYNHTQLNGAIIESEASQEKNRFKTGSLGHTDIENRSEIKTESASISAGSGGINPMQALSSALSLLGNSHESERSTTKSAISENIHIDTETPENLTALSRDTKNANQQVNKQDLKKVQERQEMAKVIGEISNNAISIATYEEREKMNKLSLEKFKLEEKYGKNHPQAQQLGEQINQIQENIDRTYGIGSPNGMAIRAVTAALQAAAQNDTNGAVVALASPYLNKQIHEMTDGDTAKDKAANLAAHALLSAVEFQVTGKDPLTGAVAGVTGEATATILTKALYDKTPDQLTASEKENISTLSQIAGGLAGALTAKANGTSEQQGGAFITATAGADTAKRAVENNFLSESSRARLNYLLQKRQRGEELSKEEKIEIVELGYFDQRSDWLLDKIKKGEKLSSVEEMDFNRFLERYIIETASSRTQYGKGERNTANPRTTYEGAMNIFKRDYLDREAVRNYSFPVYGYKEQVNDAMKHVPEEHQTLLGWGRSQNDWKADEVVYREVQNELDKEPRLPQNFAELSEEMMNSIVAVGGGRAANAKRVPIRYGIKATPTMVYNGLNGSRYRQVEDLVVGKGLNANDKLPFVEKINGYDNANINVLGHTKPIGSRYNQMNQPKNPNYQPVRNNGDYINGREYSGHALDRMQDRGIFPSVIENTIRTGNRTTNELGVSIYKDSINGVKVITNDKGKVITVTYEK